MAETIGIVQRLTIAPDWACTWIGPTPANTELLVVTDTSGVLRGNIVDALATALVSRREIKAGHADNNGEITYILIEPA